MWLVVPKVGNSVPVTYGLGRNVTDPPVIYLPQEGDWKLVQD